MPTKINVCPLTPRSFSKLRRCPRRRSKAYLWSSQSEGLRGGQRPGGWPLRSPSHVLGGKQTGERRPSSAALTADPAWDRFSHKLINNEQFCIFNSLHCWDSCQSRCADSDSDMQVGLRAGSCEAGPVAALALASGSASEQLLLKDSGHRG